MSSSAANGQAVPARPLYLAGRRKVAVPGARSPAGGGEGAVAAGPGLAARTELLARAGTVFTRPLTILLPPRQGCPFPLVRHPAFLDRTPAGRCPLRAWHPRAERAAFRAQARPCGSAPQDPARRGGPLKPGADSSSPALWTWHPQHRPQGCMFRVAGPSPALHTLAAFWPRCTAHRWPWEVGFPPHRTPTPHPFLPSLFPLRPKWPGVGSLALPLLKGPDRAKMGLK